MNEILEIAEALWNGKCTTYEHHPFSLPYGIVELAPKTWIHKGFANTLIRETPEGLIIVDPAATIDFRVKFQSIRSVTKERLNTAIFTHGHVDHIYGVDLYVKEAKKKEFEKPKVIAHKATIGRFARYQLMNGYNALVNHRQFLGGAGEPFFPTDFYTPDETIDSVQNITVGGISCELHPARGETDDVLWGYFPDNRILFTGDLIIWGIPNAGNPQKAQRYAKDWAVALREMANLHPKILVPGHGLPIIGEDRVQQVLIDTASVLEYLYQNTIDLMNQGESLETILHTIKIPVNLSSKPYLQPIYDEPEFIIRNMWRLYGGAWDLIPSHLKPALEKDQAQEIAKLAGGAENLIKRANELMNENKLRLACHFADWAVQSEPQNASIKKAAALIYENRAYSETSTMAVGVFLAEARKLSGNHLSKEIPSVTVFSVQEWNWTEKQKKS
jgi:alkyl sulfatase BDS1-like metallo-beta-lactamase superfamily hydrolase